MEFIKKEKGLNSMSSGYKPKNQNIIKLKQFLKQTENDKSNRLWKNI